MSKPAARVGDLAAHAGPIIGPGVPTVLIGGLPAAVMGDTAACPAVTGIVPHGIATIMLGSLAVIIGGKSAARAGDMTICAGGGIPGAIIPPGCPTVFIGG